MADDVIQVPPDSTGKKTRTRRQTIGVNDVHSSYVVPDTLPTFVIWSGAQAFALNKHLCAVYNPAGSGYVLRVHAVRLFNLQTTTVTGVGVQIGLSRFAVVPTGGTDLTPLSMDTDDTLPAGMLAKANPTISALSGTLSVYATNTDEVGATGAFFLSAAQANLNLVPELWEPKSVLLRPGQGLTIQNLTSTTVGSFGVQILVTKEPLT